MEQPVIRYARLLLLAWLAGCLGWNSAQAQSFEFGNYQVVSTTPLEGIGFEYVLLVNATNHAADAQGVSAQVFSSATNQVVIQGTVGFGDLALGASATCTNTFTVQQFGLVQSGLAQFDPSPLQWFASVQTMPLAVTIDTPVSGLLTSGTNVVVSGTVGPAVTGVQVGRTNATLVDTNYWALVNLEEGRNIITVLATNSYGGAGTAHVTVNRDTTPPFLSIDTPTNGTVVSSRQVMVTGQINDAVPGTVNPEQATVMVNGVAAALNNRAYSAADILLSPGTNTITAVGRDRAGNETRKQITLVYLEAASQKRLVALAGDGQTAMVGTVLAQPLLVELVDENGVAQTNQPVTFTITRSDGTLLAPPNSGRSVTVQTDDKGQASALFQLGTRAGMGNHQVAISSPGIQAQLLMSAHAFGSVPARVAALIPETQVGEVGKPLAQPWTALVSDAGGNPVAGAPISFLVIQGGGNFAGASVVTTITDSDGRGSAALTLGPAEGVNNNLVYAVVPGTTNPLQASFTASGQVAAAVPNTRVVGLVLDNANQPMSNVLCIIERTFLAAVTDQNGRFVIPNAPVGSIRLLVDARERGYPGEWHALEFDLVTVAGRDNSVDRPIYMVALDSDSAVVAGGDQDVTLHLKGMPGSSLTVFAHSMRDAAGNLITNRVTWTQVNQERVPMAPPNGSQPLIATTVQPPGLRFNPPARMCVPNAQGKPGEAFEFFGFDHDLAAFVAVGVGTVSADASQICTDAGFGVTKSGWHLPVPFAALCWICGPPPEVGPCDTYTTTQIQGALCPIYQIVPIVTFGSDSISATVEKHENVVAAVNQVLHFDVNIDDPPQTCSDRAFAYSFEWDFGDDTPKAMIKNPTHSYANRGLYNPTVTVTAGTGSASASVEVVVTSVAITRAPTEDDAGNKYGFDDMDLLDDPHVSVALGEQTFVRVVISSGINTDSLQVAPDNRSVADVVNLPDSLPSDFLLNIQGNGVGESPISIVAYEDSHPVFASVKVNVYTVKEIDKWSVYRVTDSASPNTGPLTPLDAADLKTFANGIVKQVVLNFPDVEVADKIIHYDINGNGALDYYFDGGPQPEFSVIQSAGLTGNPKVAVVKNFNFAWRLSQPAPAGTNKLFFQGTTYLSADPDNYVRLGDVLIDSVAIQSVAGTMVTLRDNLGFPHAAGETLYIPYSGVSEDPQLVKDGDSVRHVILHETLHRSDIGNLLDLDSPKNIMDWQSIGGTELRFKPQPRHYAPFGTENQWQTIP